MLTINAVKDHLEKYRHFRIVFGGDSITSTEWVHPNWREIVEYVLKEELINIFDDYRIPSWGIRCLNCGYDGSTTKDILEKTEEIVELKPDLVVMMIGGNDGILGIDLQKHWENMENIFTKLENIPLIFSTDNFPNNKLAADRYEKYVEIDKGLKFGKVQFVNLFEEFKNFDLSRLYTFKSEENPEEGIKEGDPDYWHPNQLGNAYIAKILLKEIFGIKFDPELYIKTELAGQKYPRY